MTDYNGVTSIAYDVWGRMNSKTRATIQPPEYIDSMKEKGLIKDNIRDWRDFYEDVDKNSPVPNDTARERVKYLDNILDRWEDDD